MVDRRPWWMTDDEDVCPDCEEGWLYGPRLGDRRVPCARCHGTGVVPREDG